MRNTIAFIVFCAAQTLSDGRPPRFIIWNVGQGQWTTLVTTTTCFHFDMGGEQSMLSMVEKICKSRNNEVFFSHWDWDHIGFSKSSARKLKSFCIQSRPVAPMSGFKKELIESIPQCTKHYPNFIQELTDPDALKFKKKSNDSSRVFLVLNRIIIPGDSPSQQEKFWSQKLINIHNPLLVLGHHGSRTSTSNQLLRRLPLLRMSIASARSRRYGHPHIETLIRLKLHKTAVLLTEDWGTLQFEL